MKAYHKQANSSLASSIKRSTPQPFFAISENQIVNLKYYGEILLAVLALSSVLTIAAVMPGALLAFKYFQKFRHGKKLSHYQKTHKITKTFYYLKRKGYIKTFLDKGTYKIVITKKGLKRICDLKFKALSIPRPPKWDGKYWQVAADIPTKYRSSADAFREKVRKLGLFPLQRTLWFYPFDLRKEIEIISQLYTIEPFVTVMRIDILDASDKKSIHDHFKEKGII